MEWTTIIIAVVSLGLGIAGTLFEERYIQVKRLGKLLVEVLEDKEINQEQQKKILEKIRKIFGSD